MIRGGILPESLTPPDCIATALAGLTDLTKTSSSLHARQGERTILLSSWLKGRIKTAQPHSPIILLYQNEHFLPLAYDVWQTRHGGPQKTASGMRTEALNPRGIPPAKTRPSGVRQDRTPRFNGGSIDHPSPRLIFLALETSLPWNRSWRASPL